MKDRWRGHMIVEQRSGWVYADTNELVSQNPDRPCGFCGLPNTPEGHDGCLGTLPGVMNACCGHGDPSAAYVQDYQSREKPKSFRLRSLLSE